MRSIDGREYYDDYEGCNFRNTIVNLSRGKCCCNPNCPRGNPRFGLWDRILLQWEAGGCPAFYGCSIECERELLALRVKYPPGFAV